MKIDISKYTREDRDSLKKLVLLIARRVVVPFIKATHPEYGPKDCLLVALARVQDAAWHAASDNQRVLGVRQEQAVRDYYMDGSGYTGDLAQDEYYQRERPYVTLEIIDEVKENNE